jgi:hypothetical protein
MWISPTPGGLTLTVFRFSLCLSARFAGALGFGEASLHLAEGEGSESALRAARHWASVKLRCTSPREKARSPPFGRRDIGLR